MNEGSTDFPEEHFAQVYHQLFPLVYRVAYHITGSQMMAEDLCQEAFICYFKLPKGLPSMQDAKYWLLRVTRNLALNSEKRKKVERKYIENAKKDFRGASAAPVHEDYMRKEAASLIEDAVSKLPEKYRSVFVMKEYGDLSYREIGKVLHISDSNVKIRMFRARDILSNLLKKEDFYVP